MSDLLRQEARRAFCSRRGLHTLFVLFDALWSEAEAQSTRSWVEVATALDLRGGVGRRALAILRAAGLALPIRDRGRVTHVLLRTTQSSEVTALLRDLAAGTVQADLRTGKLLQGQVERHAPFPGETPEVAENFSDQLDLHYKGPENFSDQRDLHYNAILTADLRPILAVLVAETGLAHALYNRSVSNCYPNSFLDNSYPNSLGNSYSSSILSNSSNCKLVKGDFGDPEIRPTDAVVMTPQQLEALLDQAATRAAAMRKPRKPADGWAGLSPEQQAAGLRIHALWQEAWKTDWSLTPQRKRVLAARLREGRTEEDFAAINRTFSKIPFYLGQNDRQRPYFDYTNLFGSPEKFDRNLLRARRGAADLQPPRGEQVSGRRF